MWPYDENILIVFQLSQNGCWIVTDTALLLGRTFSLILQVSRVHKSIPIATGLIRWTDTPIYGLQFLAIDESQGESLKDVLKDLRLLA